MSQQKEWPDFARFRKGSCLICKKELSLKKPLQDVAYIRYRPEGMDLICCKCFRENYIARLVSSEEVNR